MLKRNSINVQSLKQRQLALQIQFGALFGLPFRQRNITWNWTAPCKLAATEDYRVLYLAFIA